jgi:hypothetical protein
MKTLFLTTAALAALMIGAPIGKAHAETATALLQMEMSQDGLCRGSNEPESNATKLACDKRAILVGELFAKGYCIVGNSGYQQRWEKGPASRWTRRGEAADCGQYE